MIVPVSLLTNLFEVFFSNFLKIFLQFFQHPLTKSCRITKCDIEEWQHNGGVAGFISHHPVIQKDKAATRIRLVSNSSLNIDGKGNPSPNDCWQ